MKSLLPNQQSFLDIIAADARKIPRFIDAKKPEHREAFQILEQVFDILQLFAQPKILSEHTVELMEWEIRILLSEITNQMLFIKVNGYVNLRISYYLKTAVEFEFYEAAASIKKYNPE